MRSLNRCLTQRTSPRASPSAFALANSADSALLAAPAAVADHADPDGDVSRVHHLLTSRMAIVVQVVAGLRDQGHGGASARCVMVTASTHATWDAFFAEQLQQVIELEVIAGRLGPSLISNLSPRTPMRAPCLFRRSRLPDRQRRQ